VEPEDLRVLPFLLIPSIIFSIRKEWHPTSLKDFKEKSPPYQKQEFRPCSKARTQAMFIQTPSNLSTAQAKPRRPTFISKKKSFFDQMQRPP
jgi:hypothetical protein